MVDSVLSGYKEEIQTVDYTGATQAIGTLQNGEWSSLSVDIDNSVNKYLFADFYFQPTFGTTAATLGETVSLYLVPSVDGTTYPDWTDDVATEQAHNEQYYIGSFTVTAGTAAQAHSLRAVALPSGKFKLAMRNNAATGDLTAATLKYRRYNYASQ